MIPRLTITAAQEQARGGTVGLRWRQALGLTASVALLALITVMSITVGAKIISPETVGAALAGQLQTDDHFVVVGLRVPRTLAGLVVGSALGVAGALIQALTRNPLADPGILGVNAGAALFVALGVSVFGVASVSGYVWFALVGALIVTAAVYVIGTAGRQDANPVKLTLAGVALGAVLSGIVTAMVLLNPQAFNTMRNWNAGSLVNRDLNVVLPVLPLIIIGVVLSVIAARSLNAIALGDEIAKSLGVNVRTTRAIVIVAVTLLAGGATAIAGPVGFVGLMIPHIARWVVGPDQRWVITLAIVLGPSLLLAADVLGRVVMRPGEIPVGIVTAFLGAPVLIILVRRKRTSTL